ncbi:MAG: FitA-like ribbon-helix-helix domain-containing protein [Gemmatimonadota bacterium]
MQYTLRNIPAAIDRALRAVARREGKSLNEVAIRALARAVGVAEKPVRYRDLRDLAGTWQEDPEFDTVRSEHDRIDTAIWS